MKTRKIEIPGKWMLHSYYTLNPYAPDGSGRIVVSAVDLKTRLGKVYILDKDNKILNEFGENPVESSFFHTGFWQTWSPDSKYIYYQSGSMKTPLIVKHEISTGNEKNINGDMEGAPPKGEPIVSTLLGMLYAAGYGTGVYSPEDAPVPFENRDEHGLFETSIEDQTFNLKLSINDILKNHPHKDKLLQTDKELSKTFNTPSGLTLMAYCPRWNPQGSKFLFYFGNHCVKRDEPKVTYIFTCNRDFSDMHMALDLHTGGVHWSWHPDGEHLVGYGKPPDSNMPEKTVMSIVKYDGTGYRQLSSAYGSGHPSVCPTDYNLMVTDGYNGDLVIWDIQQDKCLFKKHYSNINEKTYKPTGTLRNETRVCHHPIFTPDGKTITFNVLENGLSYLYQIENIWSK